MKKTPAPPPDEFDVVVIGAGHNGLVAANYLARAGKRVVVLERALVIGGAVATREIAVDFKVSACAHVLDQFDPSIVADLKLKKHGLEFSRQELAPIALCEDGRHLYLGADEGRAETSIATHAILDAKAFGEFRRAMSRIAAAIRPLARSAPVALAGGAGDDKPYREADRALAKLNDEERRLLQDLIPGSLAALLERSFETPLLQGALAFLPCLGLGLGPRSPGSGLAFLRRLALEHTGAANATGHPKGGLGALVQALSEAATARGVDIRTGEEVKEILVERGRAAGVRLQSGVQLFAKAVVSSADPQQTYLRLLPPRALDIDFRRAVTALRAAALTAKVHLALDGLPEFTNLPIADMSGRLLIAPSLTAIEDALSAALDGGFSPDPVMEVIFPSLHDSTLAPIGQHAMSIVVQYAPYAVEGGWDKGRDALAERVLATLARYAPDLESKIVAGEILVPPDIETSFGLAGGHWHHIDLAPDQLYWRRPVPGAEDHEGPVAGLYLAGAGAHPGGGVTGLPGRNAARALLAKERRS